jgi:hypothetical protein
MMEKQQLASIVGAGNVISQPAALEQYAGNTSFVNRIKPKCIIRPKDPGQIKKIVELARKTGSPLVPVSSGPPHFRGDTVPGVGSAIIVDLSGMKKIIRVDRVNRVAMFEPGVTFGELIPAATREKLRLNLPLLPRSTKSVTASMLEREPVVIPTYHWDIADPLDCVEIIFGTGDMFRTGAAAGPGSLEEQWAAGGAQVEAAGPSSASWYRVIGGSQGTMGIVTWSSARCEILPRLEEPFIVGSSHLDGIMEIVHWLIRLRIPNECFILNSTNLATIMAGGRPRDYQSIKDSLPEWILFYNLAGYEYFPEERINAHEKDVKKIAQSANLESARSMGKVSAFDLLKKVQAPPGEFYWKQPGGWNCHEIFFISNFQKVGTLVNTVFKAAVEAGYATANLGIYIQPIVQGCNYHVEFDLFYDPENRKEVSRVKELAAGVINPLISRGAFFSRPYGESARAILNKDAATVQALRKVKTILDPDNIMNPGKLCF